MNFLLRTPFFRLLLALIAGIVSCHYFRLFDLTILMLAVPAILSVLLSFWVKDIRLAHRLRWGFGAGLIVLVYLAGYLLADRQEKQLEFEFTEEPELYRLQLIQRPDEKERSVQCVVETSLLDSVMLRMGQSANKSLSYANTIVYLQKDSLALQLERGDVLLARLHFQKPSPVQNPEGFDYAAFLHRKGIAATAYADSLNWKQLSHAENPGLLAMAEKARDRLLAVYRKLNLATDEFAVLAALTLGYKEDLDPEIMLHYSASGAMHILSVSGLHVGVIFLIVNSIVSVFFRKPSTILPKSICILLALWLYAFITGLSPSVIRASAMFSMVTLGKALGRQAQIYNTISSTAFILLLLNPSYLWDVGFQLSYSAVLGIVYFQPQLSPLLAVNNKALKWIWDLTSVSLAAQLGTLPLALFYFNQFPNYFLLTNYIAIPISSFVIYAAVGYLALFWVPLIGGVVGWGLTQLLWLLNQSIAFIHAIPGSVSQVYAGSEELLLMTLLLCCWIGYAELRKYYFIPIALTVLLCFPVRQTMEEWMAGNHKELIVYADRKAPHVQLIAGRREWVLTGDSAAFIKLAGKFRLKNQLNNQKLKVDTSSSFVMLDGLRLGVINDASFRRKTASQPLSLDYLVVNQLKGYRPDELLNCFKPRMCIAGMALSEYYSNRLKQACGERGIAFYSLRSSGAYREQLNFAQGSKSGFRKRLKKQAVDLPVNAQKVANFCYFCDV